MRLFKQEQMVSAIGIEATIFLSALIKRSNEEEKSLELIDVGGGNLGFKLDLKDLIHETGISYMGILEAISTLTIRGIMTKVFILEINDYLCVLNQDKINEIDKRMGNFIGSEVYAYPSDITDIEVRGKFELLVHNRLNTKNIDFESKVVQKNLQSIVKKINPFSVGEISSKDIFNTASLILTKNMLAIYYLDTDSSEFYEGMEVIEKTEEIFGKLKAIIPTTHDGTLISRYLSKINKCDSDVIIHSIPYISISFNLILDEAHNQWIAMLSGKKEARVEHLLPLLHNLGYLDLK